MEIEINSIKISDSRRSIDENTVEMLVESFKDVGVLHPIVIDYDYNLIAGAHRVEAAKRLGWNTISCTMIDFSEDAAKIAEEDENDVRTPNIVTRAKWLLKRKERYEALYPETKAHIAGGIARQNLASEEKFACSNMNEEQCRNEEKFAKQKTFVQQEAEKRGVSERAIEQEIQIAQNIEPDIMDFVEDININKTNALNLARKTPVEQHEIIEPIREAVQAVPPAERKQTANNLLNKKLASYKSPEEIEIDDKKSIFNSYSSAVMKLSHLEMKTQSISIFYETIAESNSVSDYLTMMERAIKNLNELQEYFLHPVKIGGFVS